MASVFLDYCSRRLLLMHHEEPVVTSLVVIRKVGPCISLCVMFAGVSEGVSGGEGMGITRLSGIGWRGRCVHTSVKDIRVFY